MSTNVPIGLDLGELLPENEWSEFEDDDGEIPEWMDFDTINVTHIVTPDEILVIGLHVGGYSEKQIEKSKLATNNYRFKITYGVTQLTLVTIYEDLQKTTAEDTTTNPPQWMGVKGSDLNLKWLFWAFYYLQNYPTEEQMVREFKVNRNWARDCIWEMIEKI